MLKRKRVLLLGDSIRMSYETIVRQKFHNIANVYGPKENCQFSLYFLSCIDEWIRDFEHPDVIHLNIGLHDIGYNPKRLPHQIPLDFYLGNIEFILEKLFATKARIIWATTTPVHPKLEFSETDWSWKNEEIIMYNNKANEIMRKNGIPINDLHSIVWGNIDGYFAEDMVHLSEEGVQHCGIAVFNAIEQNFK